MADNDRELQQRGPVAPPQFPFAPPKDWPTTPHGTFDGLGLGVTDPYRPPDTTGVKVARKQPTAERP
jgi:hypothetical protein